MVTKKLPRKRLKRNTAALWFNRFYKCLSNHKVHEGHKGEKGGKALSPLQALDQCFLVGVMALEAEPFVNADRRLILGMHI